jgi:hypothetical protein
MISLYQRGGAISRFNLEIALMSTYILGIGRISQKDKSG